MSSNGRDPVHRALDVFLYAPVGFALMAYQRVPSLVSGILARGVTQLGEAEARMNQAKMIGQVAVTYGSRQIRRDLDARLGEAVRRAEFLAGCIPGLRSDDDEDDDLLAEPVTSQVPAPPPSPAPSMTATPSTPVSAPAGPGPSASELPIPAYDGLSASQVVSRLSGLTPGELDAVAAYEAAARARKTVLGAIDRLRS
ncbi:MAG: hypothetical protein M3357_15835 [Actinomycetota bacterium]|nr:hypothetical protein [Actinomycetota bacterium]